MTCLVTGATGNVGGRVVAHLLAAGVRPRVFARDPQKARALFGDRVDVAAGDLEDRASLASALGGADVLFLVSAGAGLARRDEAAAKAARDARVKRIVKLSSMDALRGDASSVGAWHAHGQDAIRASGVPFTFVQPAGFMSNALEWARSIRADGAVRACTGEGRVAMIHPADVAAVAAAAILAPRFEGASLAITGPEALRYADMAAAIGAAIDRPVTFVPISDAEARERLLGLGMPTGVADALVGLWRAVREGRVATVTDTAQRVLGRAPISFAAWARENAAAFR